MADGPLSAGTDYERLREIAEHWRTPHRPEHMRSDVALLGDGVLALLGERDERIARYDASTAEFYASLERVNAELVAVREERDAEAARAARHDGEPSLKAPSDTRPYWQANAQGWQARAEAAERERDTAREALRRISDSYPSNLTKDAWKRHAQELRGIAYVTLSAVDTRPEDLGE